MLLEITSGESDVTLKSCFWTSYRHLGGYCENRILDFIAVLVQLSRKVLVNDLPCRAVVRIKQGVRVREENSHILP